MTETVVGLIDSHDRGQMDPGVRARLDLKARRIAEAGPYQPVATAQVEERLRAFFADERPDHAVGDVTRMGGGASKEQFLFTLTGPDGQSTYVLRMDPLQTAAETDRRREFEALNAYSGSVPAPRALWLDGDGSRLGQPAVIMNFIGGVTRPSAGLDGPNVSGLGTFFPKELRAKIGPQFVQHLATLHGVDWRDLDLPSFVAPAPGTQAALWALNWMSRVWRDDHVHDSPLVAVAERWLRRNLPVSDAATMVHGDYRVGNFMFDEDSGDITAILDWEFVHLGDFHEDLGWMVQMVFGTHEDGQDLVCGLLDKSSIIEGYERHSGRKVDAATLKWYEVYAALKTYVIVLGTSVKAARDGHNHQDVLLSWMAPVGHRFADLLSRLLSEAEASA